MTEKQPTKRIWLVLCTVASVAMDVTLNKYGSQMPSRAVLCLWAISAALFVVWLWKVETTTSLLKKRVLDHPVSYGLMLLILILFGWQPTKTVLSMVSAPKDAVPNSTPLTPVVSTPVPHSSTPDPNARAAVITRTSSPKPLTTHAPISHLTPAPVGATPPIVCDNNSGNCAGTNNGTQSVTNLYGGPEPPPNVVGLAKTVVEGRNPKDTANLENNNPGVELRFYVDAPFSSPEFVVLCDHPCKVTNWLVGHQPSWSPFQRIEDHANPNLAGVVIQSQMIAPGEEIRLTVRSVDGTSISVLGVQGYVRPARH